MHALLQVTYFQEFVGLRSKMYSIKLSLSEEQQKQSDEQVVEGGKKIDDHKLTAAGVKKKVAKRELTHDLYRGALLNHRDHYITQKILRSFNHTISNVTQHRIGLTAYDDKRYILRDGVSTRAHGHYRNRD